MNSILVINVYYWAIVYFLTACFVSEGGRRVLNSGDCFISDKM